MVKSQGPGGQSFYKEQNISTHGILLSKKIAGFERSPLLTFLKSWCPVKAYDLPYLLSASVFLPNVWAKTYVKRVQKELNILYEDMNTAAILYILLRGIFKIAKKNKQGNQILLTNT